MSFYTSTIEYRPKGDATPDGVQVTMRAYLFGAANLAKTSCTGYCRVKRIESKVRATKGQTAEL